MKRLIAGAGLALVAAASTAACGGAHTSSPSTVTVTAAPPAQTSIVRPPPPPPPPPAETGQWVTAGPLSFNVSYSLDIPIWAGDDPSFASDMGFVPPPPGTQIIGVNITVSNTSVVPRTYRAADQMLRDDQGRLFAPTAATTASDRSRVDLNPGTSHDQLWLDFAVPQGTDVSQYTLVVRGGPDSVGFIHLQ
jgi:hypothetical protein